MPSETGTPRAVAPRAGALGLAILVAFGSVLPAPLQADAWSAGATPRLAPRLEARLRHRSLRAESTGVEVILLPGGQRVFSHNADLPLRPASTLKVLTGAASLALLRPEFVFRTGIYADAPIGASGTLYGSLYIRGSGAPDLVAESWWMMARRLSGLGLKRVQGGLVADVSYFDAVARPPGWPPAEVDSWYNAPVGALSCNFNVVALRIAPSAVVGAPPGLDLEPIASYFDVVNRARTLSKPTQLAVERRDVDGRNTLVLSGTIRRGGGPVVVRRAVEGPAQYALHAFREIAAREGIDIAGPLSLGAVPARARLLAEHDSRPLAALVRDMNKYSNNFMAEMLVKTLGARLAGTPGTTAGGLQVVRDYLLRLGVDPRAARLVDGSGLSDQNRLPARLLAGVLARAHADFDIGPELTASLPIGGADGTLDTRFGSAAALRRVRAKTGRIAGAIGLAGYAINREGLTLAFAILAGDPRGTVEEAQSAVDALALEIAASDASDFDRSGPQAPSRGPERRPDR